MKVVAFIEESKIIEKILRHCELWKEPAMHPPPVKSMGPPNMSTRAICNPDFRIISWQFEDKETGNSVTAGRDIIDTIQVKGRSEKVVRVTLSPRGISGKFWKATYWYRTSDYMFLKSSMPQGVPGSSPIIIESIGIKRPK